MPSRSEPSSHPAVRFLAVVAVLAVAASGFLFGPHSGVDVASAGETSSSEDASVLAARAASDVVLVREGEVVDEDLYAGGNRILIEGVIEGDLIVFAFDRLEMSGEVQGDIIGFAPTADISGTVAGSVRLAGVNVSASGSTGDDLMVIGWDVRSVGQVGRDILAWSWGLQVGGAVGRDIEGQSIGSTVLAGTVGRDVEMTVRNLRINDTAIIGQDLAYESSRTASVSPEAVIGGTMTRRSPFLPDLRVSAIRLVAISLAVLSFLWMGLLAIWLMPRTMKEATGSVYGAPLRSLVIGVVALITPILLVASVLAIAALSPPELAFTVLGVGAPFWLGILMVLLLALFIAPVPIAITVGRLILGPGRSVFAAFLLGAVIFVGMLFIPIVGPILAALTLVLGLGSLARGAIRARGGLRWAMAEANPDRGRRWSAGAKDRKPGKRRKRRRRASSDAAAPLTSEDGIDVLPDAEAGTAIELSLVEDSDGETADEHAADGDAADETAADGVTEVNRERAEDGAPTTP